MENKLYEGLVIRIDEGLTKENFWNKATEFCPKTMKEFCDYIDGFKHLEFRVDEYERKMTWDVLFGNNTPTTQKIKFHHIPLEMQVGIIFRFFREKNQSYETPSLASGVDWFTADNWIKAICSSFTHREYYAHGEHNN